MFYFSTLIIFSFLVYLIITKRSRNEIQIEEKKDTSTSLNDLYDIETPQIDELEIGIKLEHQFLDKFNEISITYYDGIKITATAKDIINKRNIIINTLNLNVTNKEKANELFTREIEAIKRVNHPNLIKIYEIGNNENFLYYVTENMKGRSLASLLDKEKKLSLSDALDITNQALKGLLHLHNNKIIHRNITPQSIFINEKGTVKLINFEIAKLGAGPYDRLKEATMVGDLYFGAPEQIAGENVSSKSDIFALGACLFYMLSNEFPFDNQALSLNKESRPKDLSKFCPQVPKAIITIISNCLEKNPDNRSSSMDLWKEIREVKI